MRISDLLSYELSLNSIGQLWDNFLSLDLTSIIAIVVVVYLLGLFPLSKLTIKIASSHLREQKKRLKRPVDFSNDEKNEIATAAALYPVALPLFSIVYLLDFFEKQLKKSIPNQ